MSPSLPLAAAIDLVVGVVERRTTVPILSNVLLEADGKWLRMTGTDMDNELSVSVPCDSEKLSTTVDAHLFKAIVSNVGTVDGLRLDGKKLIIGSGPTFALDTLPADEFPRAKDVEPTQAFELPAAQLLADLTAVWPAICTEEARYYLQGVNMETHEGKLSLAATDGHRLHMVERDAPAGAEALGQYIVMRGTVKALRAAIAVAPEVATVKLSFERLRAQFEVGTVTIKAKLIDGTYPDVRRVFPGKATGTLTVNAAELLTCVEAAKLVGSDRNRFVKLDLKGGIVSSEDSGGAKMNAAMPGVKDGSFPDEIGFNAPYLAAICESFKGDEIVVSFTDAASPTLFAGPQCALRTVLMPVRL